MKIWTLITHLMVVSGVLVIHLLPMIIIFGFFDPEGFWQQYITLITTLGWMKAINLNLLRGFIIFVGVFENDDEDLMKIAEFIKQLINQERQKLHMECEIDGQCK